MERYLLLSNSHDGEGSVQVKFTPIRVVCQNTFVQALGRGPTVRVAHPPDLEQWLAEARRLLGFIDHTYKRLETTFAAMVQVPLDSQGLRAYLREVFPDPRDADGLVARNRVGASRFWPEHLFTNGKGNDARAVRGTLWAAYNGVAEFGASVYLLARFKAKASFVETLDAIRRMVALFPATSAVLIEDAANGAAVVNVLQEQIPGIIAVRPDGSKFARAAAVQPQVEARQVSLPRPRDASGHARHEYAWVDDFVKNCAMFPKGENDDDVDAFTQLLLRRPQPRGMSMGDVIRFMTHDEEESDQDGDAGPSGDFRYRGYHQKQF